MHCDSISRRQIAFAIQYNVLQSPKSSRKYSTYTTDRQIAGSNLGVGYTFIVFFPAVF